MAREIPMPDGGRVLILSANEGLIEHMARGECVIGIMSDVAPPALMSGCYLVEDENQVEQSFVEKVYERFQKKPWTIGVGRRVLLRELTIADYDPLFLLELEYYNEKKENNQAQAEIASVLGLTDPRTYSEEEGRTRLRTYITQQYPFYELGLWAVTDKDTGEFLGICGFSDTLDYGFTLGYHIAKKHRGCGFAKEACELAIEFAVSWQEMPEVVCLVAPENRASICVAVDLGMEQTDTYQDHLLFRKTTIKEEETVPLTKQMLGWFSKVAGKYFKKKHS